MRVMQANPTKMVFSAQKMIDRVMEEGKAGLLDDNTLAFIRELDGRPVTDDSWNRRVKGYPVYSCTTAEGEAVDVNENDCVPIIAVRP